MKILILTIIICFMIILCYKFTTVEGMSEQHKIILMGDSILKNNTYVTKGNSVEEQLHELHKNSLVIAEDGSTVYDLDRQYNKLKDVNINSDTYIVISIGGNDLLHAYAFNDIKNHHDLNDIFDRYIKFIKKIKNMYKCNYIFCTIYYPKNKSFLRFYDLIELWNAKLCNYVSTQPNDNILYLDEEFDKEKYFTHDIEPSKYGSKIIVDMILKMST